MEIAEALAFLEGCRFWSITAQAMSCSYATPRPRSRAEAQGWQPFIRTSVRRGKAESLEAMVVRCAAKASERQASSWRSCQACGSSEAVEQERRLKMALCRACREGLGQPVRRSREAGRPSGGAARPASRPQL